MLTRVLESVASAAVAVVWLFALAGAGIALVLLSPILLAIWVGKRLTGAKSA